jgi:signal transduction histidine kinase
MDAILDDLAVLAEAERPDFVQPAATELRPLTQEVAADARTATGRDCVVEAHAPGAAVLDAGRVRQAVLRLAANAARFAPAGEPIRIGSGRDDSAVRFWVSDQGPGLRDGDAERVFDRFARGSDTDPVGGTDSAGGDAPANGAGPGLGLAVVRAVADAHQGAAYVDSRPGEGATFGLELPLQAPPDEATREAPVAGRRPEPALR